MTTIVVTARRTSGTTQDDYTARTFTVGSIDVRDGNPTLEQLLSVFHAIEDLHITRLNGEIFADVSLEMKLTIPPSD